ncbi:MAG: DUF4097 family beta strand repeat protein [Clostridia bacterium]|nr:DUF4097 family beta strand repeat protein [Clostridia bacterium]
MRKSMKFWLTASAALIASGSIMFTVTACSINWDFKKFNTTNFETTTHEISDTFQNITVDNATAAIEFLQATNEKCTIVCYEDVKLTHSVSVENGTLTVKTQDERKWYDHLSMGSYAPTLTIYLPQIEYSALSIETTTGDVTIAKEFTFDSVNISGRTSDITCFASVKNSLNVKITTGDIDLHSLTAGAIDLETTTGDIEATSVKVENDFTLAVDTGDIELTDVTCQNFTSTGDTGDLEMKNLLTTGKMSITRNTGEVELNACDAAEIYIKTSTGDVEGSLRTTKDFHADSKSGDVKVPHSSVGGKCEITCSSGDIHITVLDGNN